MAAFALWLLICQHFLSSCGVLSAIPCTCHLCCDKPPCPKATNETWCWGSAVGCSASKQRKACYGRHGSGVSGDCLCAGSGSFRNPERFTISGTVKGLAGALTMQVSFTSNRRITGKHFNSEQGVAQARLVQNGPFKFPAKLAKGQVFHVEVLEQPPAQHCLIFRGSRPKQITANVNSIIVHCKIVPQDKKKIAAMQKKNAAEHKALEKKLSKAEACYSSELLNPLPTGVMPQEKYELKSTTRLPCRKSFTLDDIQNNQIANKIYATEVRGKSCFRSRIFADNFVASCFVPTAAWFEANNDIKPLLRNDDKGAKRACYCEGQKVCSLNRADLLKNTTYMLIVAGYGEADQRHAKSVHFEVYVEPCEMPVGQQILLGGLCALVFVGIVVLKRLQKKRQRMAAEEQQHILPGKAKGGKYIKHHENL